MVDFRFELNGELQRGVRTIRFQTVGPSMHECDIYGLDTGRTVDHLRAWQGDRDGLPLPGKVLGGVLDSHDISRVVWLRREFQPGNYVLWCGMPIVQNAEKEDPGMEHATHDRAGMVLEFSVD